ncbi:T-cell surface glycoprotein CD8 beta chain isoform X1 [Manacus candei]|uniref:T-cell surface glycoprotein CD8 beta chain isoform X1 n=1 Tax=Manacus candei TaxID=415023 RepID=UPI0022274300|nr:T-cell surface glycoprotein CD8 beta chain isoform X1 [Manacus candei]
MSWQSREAEEGRCRVPADLAPLRGFEGNLCSAGRGAQRGRSCCAETPGAALADALWQPLVRHLCQDGEELPEVKPSLPAGGDRGWRRGPGTNPSVTDSTTMARPWLHLCICLQIPGFCRNLLLSQTPEHILAQTNNKTEILCELKKEHTGLYWYRWSQERQIFEFLVFCNLLGKTTYGANISQNKFSVHRASVHNSYSLHISHLHALDNGIYYCSVSQSSQLFLGSGTQLSVVDVLPLPSKTTQAPVSKKPVRCITTCKAASKKGPCSPLIWIPLAAGALLLLLTLISTAHRLHRLRRRLWLRIHRQ